MTMYAYSFGELTDKAKVDIESCMDPFSVLKNEQRITDGWGHDYFIMVANDMLGDCYKIDWGSCVWKCTKHQLLDFLRKSRFMPVEAEAKHRLTHHGVISNYEFESVLGKMQAELSDVEYGILYIECY